MEANQFQKDVKSEFVWDFKKRDFFKAMRFRTFWLLLTLRLTL